MAEVESRTRRTQLWKNLKQRLGFKGMGCCGPSSWGHLTTDTIRVELEDDDVPELLTRHQHYYPPDEEQEQLIPVAAAAPVALRRSPPCLGQIQASSGMNLAAALAAERHSGPAATAAPFKSLMRLFEETDGVDLKKRCNSKKDSGNREEEGVAVDGMFTCCCVCMERSKGAAFIPCGHTYCRVCSRELWLNRGSCPLCNRPITDILDIF